MIQIMILLEIRSKLRTIRKKKKVIKTRETSLIKRSKTVYDLLCECIDLDEEGQINKTELNKERAHYLNT